MILKRIILDIKTERNILNSISMTMLIIIDSILYNLKLKNGTHNLKIRVKDNYGNETIKTYYFTVNDPNGTSAQITVVPKDLRPIINKAYTLNVINKGEIIDEAYIVKVVRNYSPIFDI